MSNQVLEIKVSQDIEPYTQWPDICRSPNTFFIEIAKRLFVDVDVSQIGSNIVISPTIPLSKDRSKVWVKTSWPYGFGIVADGVYKMDYGMSGFPVSIPFLHKQFTVKPAYVEEIGSLALAEYGMKNIDTVDAKNRFLWYIFNPPVFTL